MPDFGRWTSNGGDPSLNEINRTDRFLDSLAFEQPVYSTDPGEAELAGLLAGWRDEVRDAPLTAALTPRDAVLALDNARASRRRTRMSLAVVGSAAAAVLCLGGFVSVVAGAGPGDTLYGLRTMIFGEQQAPRDDAVMLASQQLAEVQQLIDQGQWQAAQDKLQTLTTTVATVNDVEQKQELVTQWQEMTVKVESQDANATPPPGEPLPRMPDVPVVVAPGSDTSTTTSTTTSSTTTSSETTPSTPIPTPSTPLPTPSTPLPTPSTPIPTPSTPLPTPSTPLPTPSTPIPTPSTPLPTPSTPIPTPSTTVSITPRPLPVPQVPPSEVEQQEETTSEAPPILLSPPPEVVTTTVAVPAQPPSEVAEEEPAAEEPPVRQAPAPKTVVTTTAVVPAPGDEPR